LQGDGRDRKQRDLKDDILPDGILNETIARVTDIFGDELDSIMVEVA